jgi:hypothetical protein
LKFLAVSGQISIFTRRPPRRARLSRSKASDSPRRERRFGPPSTSRARKEDQEKGRRKPGETGIYGDWKLSCVYIWLILVNIPEIWYCNDHNQ